MRDDLLCSESQHLKDSSVWKHLWVLINDSLMKAPVNLCHISSIVFLNMTLRKEYHYYNSVCKKLIHLSGRELSICGGTKN